MRIRITDWDDAYSNGAHIPNGAGYPARWAAEAARFRDGLRAEAGIFWPEGVPAGLMVFVHGGYWMQFGPEDFTHLARGALKRGWAVLMPDYPLAPAARISQITAAVGAQITAAAAVVDGPIALCGHSAGGHLAARMVCEDGPLPDAVAARVSVCVPVSGIFDLRPLMFTEMNDVLHLDPVEAMAESPALSVPLSGVRLTAWVGATERSEFIRQSELIANIWRGLGAATACVIEPDRHHFNVIEGLTHPHHPLTDLLLS